MMMDTTMFQRQSASDLIWGRHRKAMHTRPAGPVVAASLKTIPPVAARLSKC